MLILTIPFAIDILSWSHAIFSPAGVSRSEDKTIKIIHVELGGHCSLGAAPVGPGGSWQIVEKNVKKICPPGSSCRRGACNCNDLEDGTVTSLAFNFEGVGACKRIAGQKCDSSDQCFEDDGVKCLEGICTCQISTDTERCVDWKHDVMIMA